MSTIADTFPRFSPARSLRFAQPRPAGGKGVPKSACRYAEIGIPDLRRYPPAAARYGGSLEVEARVPGVWLRCGRAASLTSPFWELS
jgi:hypothetical protein